MSSRGRLSSRASCSAAVDIVNTRMIRTRSAAPPAGSQTEVVAESLGPLGRDEAPATDGALRFELFRFKGYQLEESLRAAVGHTATKARCFDTSSRGSTSCGVCRALVLRVMIWALTVKSVQKSV